MLTKTLMLLAMMQGPAHDPAETALAWVRQLDAGGFDSAAAQIDPSVPAGVMSADRLRLIWGAVTQQYGKLGRLDRGSVATRDTLTLVELVAGFASQPMGVRVVLTPHL